MNLQGYLSIPQLVKKYKKCDGFWRSRLDRLEHVRVNASLILVKDQHLENFIKKVEAEILVKQRESVKRAQLKRVEMQQQAKAATPVKVMKLPDMTPTLGTTDVIREMQVIRGQVCGAVGNAVADIQKLAEGNTKLRTTAGLIAGDMTELLKRQDEMQSEIVAHLKGIEKLLTELRDIWKK
ncbi:MAG: hypothetical protein K2W95_00925 [Candidatus Obscuribacterales bacterium]|nr:hypothetical protein [Candidatus Obscuribacterales bacterium]